MQNHRFQPPNSHSNGNAPRLTLDTGFQRDALRPKLHRVLCEVEPGKWQIMGDTSQPIELLRIDVAAQHAIGLQRTNFMIVDEKGVGTDKFDNYTPKPQPDGDPITPENQRIRDRWIQSIILWLLPRELQQVEDSAVSRAKIKEHLDSAKVDISIRPDGCQAVISRDGEPLATWAC